MRPWRRWRWPTSTGCSHLPRRGGGRWPAGRRRTAGGWRQTGGGVRGGGAPEPGREPAMKSIRKRTRAREIAIQALYQYDALRRIAGEGGAEPGAGPGGFPTEGPVPAWAEMEKFIAAETQDPEIGEFARELVSGTLDSLEDID